MQLAFGFRPDKGHGLSYETPRALSGDCGIEVLEIAFIELPRMQKPLQTNGFDHTDRLAIVGTGVSVSRSWRMERRPELFASPPDPARWASNLKRHG